ncbi:MAG: 6-pyruvoyl-tetrahydropterin synthase-related protein [Gallionellaceae bacterium]|jgi:hypothetical protein
MRAFILRLRQLLPGFAEIIVVSAFAALIAATLGIQFLNSANWPTGGDAASHLLYVWLYANELLFSGDLTPWVTEVFGGLPFLSYYFPLPFISIALLSKIIGIAPAFKWGVFLATLLLPGAVFVASRRWLNFSWQAALFGALGALAFLLHEQNSIWGGNLLSTLSGEFSYSYGLLFAVLAMLAWSRTVSSGKGWILAGVLEAACGFSHGFPLLVVGFSTLLLLLDSRNIRHTFALLLRGHVLAFCLLGGWLWPMLEMHSLTIPNDASFPVETWRDLLPATLWPILAGGVSGALMLLNPAVRSALSAEQARALRYLIGGAGLACVGFIAGDQMGLADIRFFPLTWLLGAIVCGWLFGHALAHLGNPTEFTGNIPRVLLAMAAVLALLGWFSGQIRKAPDWALWNHSGLEAKPQWHNLSQLFPALTGNQWSPRLVFEHDPANSDIGSTRSLEALPMFLNHRPVLEGLYMESALLGPAIYQLQSEISTRPSSPLVRFPSGSLDVPFAAQHMNFLHADTLLLRSGGAKNAIENSGLFIKTGESLPFAVYQLKAFDSHLIEIVKQPLRIIPKQDWMQDAFAWFRTRSRFEAYLPVYGEDKNLANIAPGKTEGKVAETSLKRHELIFNTTAIGHPHLIKMAYHPRWQLASKGSLHIAGPGYMLVVPQESEIRLFFGHTLIGQAGMIASTSALIFLMFKLFGRVPAGAYFGARVFRRRVRSAHHVAWNTPYENLAIPDRLPLSQRGIEGDLLPVEMTPPGKETNTMWRMVAAWILLIILGIYFGLRSPEAVYSQAWVEMRANRYVKASELFERAYQLRRPPAKKEEALFWLAKSSELAGLPGVAKIHYLALTEHYHGYWLPESLYTLAMLEQQSGQLAEMAEHVKRLREEYPNNSWTQKLVGNFKNL